MVDDGSKVSEMRPEILVDSGYTYFGQLIAHDLTKDVSSVDEAWQKEPEDLPNLQTARLDLNVLYGGGPDRSPQLYERDGTRLRIGQGAGKAGSFDVCTDPNGQRLLADERSAANLILRQMIAVFARFHNFAVEQLQATISDPKKVFRAARGKVQQQFHWLVCKDYLRSLLDPMVYGRVFVKRRPLMHWRSFSIPIEFAAAAMRFGHAMVRPNYLFSFGNDMRLNNTLGRTCDRGPILENLKIEWGFFFRGAGPGRTVHARPIDTRLSPPLHGLPGDLIGVTEIACPHFRIARNPNELAIRTLLRGAGLRLPSGQTVARALGETVLREEELVQNADGHVTNQGRILRGFDLVKATPLWYYILKESEVRHHGNRLGLVGSHLIAETIHAALRYDRVSQRSNDLPPTWQFPCGSRRLYTLSEFFRAVPLL
jgi:hypothetical protein